MLRLAQRQQRLLHQVGNSGGAHAVAEERRQRSSMPLDELLARVPIAGLPGGE